MAWVSGRFLPIVVALWIVALAKGASAEIELAPSAPSDEIVVAADRAWRWKQGSYDVWVLKGNCYLNQGLNYCRSHEAVLWVKPAQQTGDSNKVIAYLERDVRLESGGRRTMPSDARSSRSAGDAGWLGRFFSTAPIRWNVPPPEQRPKVAPAVYERGMARREPYAEPEIQRTQFAPLDGETIPPAAPAPPVRRLRLFRRSSVPFQAEWLPGADGSVGIAVITGGVNVIIDGVAPEGVIDISTDNAVIWTASSLEAADSGETLQDGKEPLELYLEGNIVFRQGDRVVYADRMYYDVNAKIGTVLGAEILTPVRDYNGLVRLKAAILRQTGPDRFVAENSFLTSSRLAHPRYRLQSREIYYEDQQQPLVDPLTGEAQLDPATGEPLLAHRRLATSRNNLLFLGPVPVFYWPRFATNLEDPSLFIRSAQLQNDRIFGLWASVDLDAYQLLGWQNAPQGTDWKFSLDELTDRGFGGGTTFAYQRLNVFGATGPASGLLDFWAIGDSGVDNLGGERSALIPEEDFRYRFLGRHRQTIAGDIQLTAELGLISDRNFLEQYYEGEWDQNKDQATGVELKRLTDNRSWSITADARVNDFFTQTEWLPRGDHFWLGQPLLGDRFTWYEHSQAGYARLRTASTPIDPVDRSRFAPLPWEVTSSGERLVTRQEIDWPIELGPVKVVPYGLGELAHWGEDLSGDPLNRAYGQVGIRASIPFWAVNPFVENPLFNVHGLAHKVVVDADVSYADASRDLGELPLYDPLDDDSVEHFRRRLAFSTFGGATPIRFDERFYALRTGMQNWVTAPGTEIADDLTAARFGVRQRWQTKRGPPERRRIIDWIVLDTEAAWFPKPDRDNFGTSLGLAGYNFRWHVGDRLTLLSDGGFDFFDDAGKAFTVSAFLNRPPRADWYISFRTLSGPISSQVVSTGYTYRLSPKWIASAGSSYDFGETGSIGQHLGITRVGESLLTSLDINVDSGKDNVGVNFFIQPRFLPATRGPQVPVAGLYGLE